MCKALELWNASNSNISFFINEEKCQNKNLLKFVKKKSLCYCHWKWGYLVFFCSQLGALILATPSKWWITKYIPIDRSLKYLMLAFSNKYCKMNWHRNIYHNNGAWYHIDTVCKENGWLCWEDDGVYRNKSEIE